MTMPRRRRSVAQAHLLAVLTDQLGAMIPGDPRPLDVVDLGGGTGGLAIDIAALGHRVTVIDPSPDALASLERRTADADLPGEVVGRQGDASDLVTVVGRQSVDVVVCHRVLEVVDSPAEALAAIAAVLRPGGALSLLAPQKHALVLSQALAGHPGQARRTWADASRFDHRTLTGLVRAAGFTLVAAHGIGAISDLVPEAVTDSDPTAHAELAALEAEVSQDPAFRSLAPHVHLFGRVAAGH